MTQLTELQRSVLATIRDFVRREVEPVAGSYDEADEYPADLVSRMRELGLFGATIPEEYGGGGMDVATYALTIEELAKGWMSLTGFLNTHLLLADMLVRFGTDEQKQRYLPVMATGELRGGLCITEPDAGTDVQAISTRAVRDGEEYVLNGTKTLITNGRHGGLFGVVSKTDPGASPAYRGISILLAERSPGFNVVRDIPKLGYRGIDTCEITFDDLRVPAANLLGGVEGQGFGHVMAGLELGRINVAARAVGVGRAALEAATQYAQQRHSFGKPIAEHQAIQLKLADMATQLQAAHLLVMHAAALKDRGARVDFEAGMAKLFASEACLTVSTDAMRIHGGYGYTKDLPIERYFRDAPLMIIGEGTNEIQRVVIARNLVKRFPSGDFLHEAAL
ncbi:MAG TPA: acyl-CoA dehydrogenase [Candidatus Latescibacteria bacterium]|nr:acyl-CoA dehydrogenase [Candidatus Latescibacterota bacterium]